MAELDRSHQPTGAFVRVFREFDGAAGLGSIISTGGLLHAFHVIEIADGSRSVEVGVDVSFDLLAKFGRYEAANIRVAAAP
ncbi:MAG: hypothetical protein O3B90_01385 [Actinomycetota bacterium]|nr:hypothetical protein [Actinomycetota bacterium]